MGWRLWYTHFKIKSVTFLKAEEYVAQCKYQYSHCSSVCLHKYMELAGHSKEDDKQNNPEGVIQT